MHYRKPQHPKLDRWEHRQSWAARLVALGLLLLLGALAIGLADRTVPRQHLPWKALSLSDPLGLATRIKLRDIGQTCRQTLSQGDVTFTEEPDSAEGDDCRVRDAVILTSGIAPLHPQAVMMCRQALAFAEWERQIVQPRAQELLGSPVVSMEQYGAYQCRRRYGREDQPISEHALADAVDVGVFTLADGRHISVADDWTDAGPRGVFLHAVRDQACAIFSTVLSPDYNTEHHNHLHLDMMPLEAGRGRFCH